MRVLLHRLGTCAVALAFSFLALPPPGPASADDGPNAASARAVALLNAGCDVAPPRVIAQNDQTTAPVESPSPGVNASAEEQPTTPPSPGATPSPGTTATPIPPPVAPRGPVQLVPPAPTPTGPTPPPLPTSSPTPLGTPLPAYIPAQAITAPPSSTPVPVPSYSAGPISSPTPAPAPTLPPGSQTLGPNDYAILGDKLVGKNVSGAPQDLSGHVNIIYQDGILAGDHAHYDGKRYIDVTGNVFVTDRTGDTVFHARAVRFDTQTQQATLIDGTGESTQGVERGKIHFRATDMVTDRNGVTHGEHAFLTTCENPHAGYHIESKTLDVYPGNKAVAHSATVYLGGLAVFYLPIVVISLAAERLGSRRNPGFLPVVGYDQIEGFYIKARLGFSPSDFYYGYYRIEEYTKEGLGLGYVATIKKRNGKRQTDINYFRQQNRIEQTTNTTLQINDQENFSAHTRGQFSINYTDNYGPNITLPSQTNLTAAVDHADAKGDRQDYSFNRTQTGSESQSNDFGFSDHHQFNQKLSNDLTVSYTTDEVSGFGVSTPLQTTLHYETLTHYTTPGLDYDLTYDHYDEEPLSQLQTEPQLVVHPHAPLFPKLLWLPTTWQFTFGDYYDPEANLNTSAADGKLTLGPGLAHFAGSDLSAQLTLEQDAFATGDLKAQIGQQATLTTPLWGHVVNTLSYTEDHTNGPLAEPFKELYVLGYGNKQANDILRIFNGNTYSFSLTATTLFNRQAQAVGYQLTSQPSSRSTVLLSGSFTPGAGLGFDRTSVQFSTPVGYMSTLEFAGYVDWKNHERIEDKNIYYKRVIGNCYDVLLSYNQDLKQVNLAVELLAFPSYQANFGIGQTGSLNQIIPQNFTNGSLY